MEAWKIISVLALVGILTWGGYILLQQKRSLEEEVSDLRETVDKFEEENDSIRADIEYYEDPENLLKKTREFNYKEPGERLLILVPEESTTTEATSTSQ